MNFKEIEKNRLKPFKNVPVGDFFFYFGRLYRKTKPLEAFNISGFLNEAHFTFNMPVIHIKFTDDPIYYEVID